MTSRLSIAREADPSARRTALLLAVGIGAAMVTATLLVAAPLAGFGIVVGAVVVALMMVLGRRSAPVFLLPLGVLLIAYAMAGRGVAYVGTGQLFVGEAVLFLGIVAFLLNVGRARFGLVHWLIVAFMVIGLARTLPFLGAYGMVALRDGVVWGYAAFALIVATVFEPRWFDRLTSAYRAIAPLYLLWLPLAVLLTISFVDRLPGWPGAPVPIVVVKQGDFAVHLAGIAAFMLVGLYGARRPWLPSWLLWALLFADLAIVGSVSRGGMLSIFVGGASALLFVRSGPRLGTALGIALAGFVLLYAINPTLDVGSGQGRNLSFSQLVENAVSVVTASDSGNLQGTKAWRLAWWDEIIDYTIDGPYYWTGKGFGINLADADGFQVLADRSLRQPHNGHLALLARGGVPLLAAWILIQACFGAGLLRAASRARRAGRTLLVQLAGWTFAVWIAALVNMSFDVYLEGPQGGIWFWSVVGFGLVVMRAAHEPTDSAPPSELAPVVPPPSRGAHLAGPGSPPA